ncbi:MAG: ribose 5-phosphate isomerase B [Chloroflexi bacterium HGW-Chloroflexi-4]|jgi:RpiB/LacA/LacB family sugar-phosphate isomerase|nr:MAG: ribose 5-phosphate isomerase B [Chloroflexi bacterium HGW-Chloroflexi-7]PKN99860.1 MAG: ribose 5-phosphate isomerase B [Chloroflexi bacterium HGW-Chloroflexi-4]
MQIAVACDHAGFPLKDEVIAALEAAGCSTIDLGTYDQEPVDYPDYAEKAGRAIINGQAERAVLVCGSGIGACIAANKMKGIYACNVNDVYSARQGVEHDNMNVLCLGARVIGPQTAKELVTAFVGAHFSAEERHQRRFGKILKLEANGKKE